MQAFANTLVRFIREHGGEGYLGMPVERIWVEDGRGIGITLYRACLIEGPALILPISDALSTRAPLAPFLPRELSSRQFTSATDGVRWMLSMVGCGCRKIGRLPTSSRLVARRLIP